MIFFLTYFYVQHLTFLPMVMHMHEIYEYIRKLVYFFLDQLGFSVTCTRESVFRPSLKLHQLEMSSCC